MSKQMFYSKVILVLALSIFIAGCIDFGEEGMWTVDKVAVTPGGKVALCIDESVYITDLQGSSFTRAGGGYSVAWSDGGRYLLYAEEAEDVWKLNLYPVSDRQSINLLQEMYPVALPGFSYNSENIAYMVFPEEGSLTGNLNVYERASSSIYTLIEDAYYDYKWLPGTQKIVAISVTEEFEEVFQGRLIIKDIEGFGEDIIFDGDFSMRRNAVDVTPGGKTILFNAGDGIYLYNVEDKSLTKWSGPEGYEFRLGIQGYMLAHVKGSEDEWAGQLYLVSPDKRIIEVPGWPVWIKEPDVVYMDLYEGEVLVLNLDTGEIVNLNEKYEPEED